MKFKTIYKLLFVAVFALIGIGQANATHLVGGYMSYKFLRTESNNDKTFLLELTLFRDVEQSNVDFDDQIEIGIYLNNAERDRNQLLNVNILTRKLVKPPGSEDCDYYSNKKIEMGYYQRTVTLSPYAQGYHVYFVRCCRNIQNNLTQGSSGEPDQGQTYYCFIPNPALENSSPYFTGVPSPYMCNNDSNTFLNRAVDPDGDSLVYKIVRPYQGGDIGQNASKPTPPIKLRLPIDTVDYKQGFHQFKPFGDDGVAIVDRSNGLTTLLSRKVGSFVIAIEVEEYRNGVLLSRVRLDMQILVLNCPPNKKPVVSNDGGKYFEIEAGERLCFMVQGRDPDINPVQSVTIYGTGDILTGENGAKAPLATMNLAKGLGNVQSEFCWTPSCEHARDEPYLVAFSAQDDGCPPKYDNYNVEIKVNKFVGSKTIQGPQKVCATSIYEYEFEAINPKPNSSFWWDVTNGSIVGDRTKDKVTITFKGTDNAIIRMVEISQYGCPGDTASYQVELIPSPETPIITGQDTVCLDQLNEQYSVTNIPGSSYQWFLPNGSIGSSSTNTEQYSWNQLGDFKIKVVETNKEGCSSDTGSIDVNVRKPVPSLIGPTSVCPNSKNIEYTAVGHPNSTYGWSISGGSQVSGGSTKLISVDWGNEGLGLVTITETDKWGCVSDPVATSIDKTYDLEGFEPIGDVSVCEFDQNDLYYVIESSGSRYNWSISGGLQVSGDTSSQIRVDWGPTGMGNVSVQQTAYDNVNDKQCASPVLSLDVVINPLPTADVIEGDFKFCQGSEERVFTVNGFSGSTYQWLVNGSDVGFIGQGTNQITTIWPDHGTFNMQVLELSKDSCPGTLIDTTIIVHPKPIADEILGEHIKCFPNVLQSVYQLKGYPNSTYSWTVTNGNVTSENVDSIVIDWNDKGYGNISVVETSEFGCVGDSVFLPVYINNIEIDLDRISVGFPDDRMLGEWRTLNDDLTNEPFTLEKRAFGVDVVWNLVQSEYYKDFTEFDVNTDVTPFEYQVKTTDLCGNVVFSEIHRSILLTGEQNTDDFSIELDFTPYVGWDNGVDFYDLYKSVNEDRTLYRMQTVQEGSIISIPGSSKDYRQCFRIKAAELAGQEKISWSNEVCFYFSPNVYVPTAFSPNGDGLNETFHPVSVAVKDFSMSVFNRWGEKIFVTENQDIGWDGTYGGRIVQSGIYMYLLEFTDANDKRYQKSGTIQLTR